MNKIKSHKNSKLHKPHDRFFRQNLTNVAIAKDFLTTHLPTEILTKVDLNSLELYPDSFIEEELQEKIADLVYKVKIQDEYGYITLLIEHQSIDDPVMAFRLLKYRVLLMEKHLKQTIESDNNKKPQKLPIILSLLFYHGEKSPYPYSTDLFDLFDNKELAKQIFCQPFHLIDVTQISDYEIKQHKLIGLLELVQKHIRDRNFLLNLQNLTEIITNMLDFSSQNYCMIMDYIENTIYYIINIANIDNFGVFNQALENISIIKEHKIMATIAQQLEQRGEQRGIQLGKIRGYEQVARNLLKEGLSKDLIMRTTGLTTEELENLQKKQ